LEAPVSNLNNIGNKYATDKSSKGKQQAEEGGGLDYLRLYEAFLENRRDNVKKVLEIGVLKGASLRVWEEYFPNALIFGIDINESAKRVASERIKIEILDQSDKEAVIQFAQQHGPFDIVIEDGSHRWEHQINNLKWLIPHVSRGGVYIVEDLQTSYNSDYGQDSQKPAVQFALEIIEDVIAGKFRSSSVDKSRREISNLIETTHVMRHAVAFFLK
jgi:predicted O-methyltransferase YrrM